MPTNRLLKRFTLCAGITLVALSGIIALWYKSHYTLPPYQERQVTLPNPNGYDTLSEALKLEITELAGIYVNLRALNSSPPYHYPPQPLEGRLKLVAANQAAIAKTREALDQKYLTPTEIVSSDDSPRQPALREQARMLAFASRTHAEAGNLPEAMTCAIDGIAMGVQSPRGGSIIPALVGNACESISRKAAWELVDRVDAKTARVATARLENIEECRWPLVKSFEADMRTKTHTYVLSLFPDGSVKKTWERLNRGIDPRAVAQLAADGITLPQPTVKERAQRLWYRATVVYYGPRIVLENSEKCLTAVQERAKYPWGSPRPGLPEMQDPVSQEVVFSASNFESVEFKYLNAQAQNRLLQVYLALRAYQLEKGSYPGSLDTLVAEGYLKSVPVDPFSPTRASLRYESPSGKLWSIGPDGVENQGQSIGSRSWRQEGHYLPGDIVAGIDTS